MPDPPPADISTVEKEVVLAIEDLRAFPVEVSVD
jgi:hypothetical protein